MEERKIKWDGRGAFRRCPECNTKARFSVLERRLLCKKCNQFLDE